MLCKIRGFHGGDYEECRLLGCYAVGSYKSHTALASQNMSFFLISKVSKRLQTVPLPSQQAELYVFSYNGEAIIGACTGWTCALVIYRDTDLRICILLREFLLHTIFTVIQSVLRLKNTIFGRLLGKTVFTTRFKYTVSKNFTEMKKKLHHESLLNLRTINL
jgi:hypothetical protein